MEPIILASSSLRRQDIFKQLSLPFSIMPSPLDETLISGLSPKDQTIQLAMQKVEYVKNTIKDRALPWVFGADTLVYVDDEPLGKAQDRKDAERMIRLLAGRTHYVTTGMALYSEKTGLITTAHNTSSVTFAPINDYELGKYLDLSEWQGVAGAYRIQGTASIFIKECTGSYSSIVGLPIRDFYVMLSESGYQFWD